MAFWDKREDPWEWKDGKNPKAPPPQEKDEGEVESLLGEIAAWNQERKEEKARRQAPPPPMECPWCGREMEIGYLGGGRDWVYWSPRRPRALEVRQAEGRIRVDTQGSFLVRYHAAYYCPHCDKMVMDSGDMAAFQEGPAWWREEQKQSDTADEG